MGGLSPSWRDGMLKAIVASLVLVVASVGAAPRAEAKGIPIPVVWGNHFNFDHIATLKMSPEFREAFPELHADAELTHVSESWVLFWVAGLWVTDKGYALHNPGDETGWEISADDVKMLQQEGIVPDPLPVDGIQPMTYAAGFSVWIVALVLLGLFLLSRRRATA